MDTIPIAVVFLVTVLIVVAAIELGYRFGQKAHQRSDDEKESPVSAISGTILGLLAFILAFTFAIASDRHDAKKSLVREEAAALRTAFSRAHFLPQEDYQTATKLLLQYVDGRLQLAQKRDLSKLPQALHEAEVIQQQLWQMAVKNARRDMNSDVAALYIESLNDLTNLHWMRVAIGVQVRIPDAIWGMLYTLIIISMIGIGYQTGIAGSKRTWATLMLAISFSLVITLITELDRPDSRLIQVTQQPLIDLQRWMIAQATQPY